MTNSNPRSNRRPGVAAVETAVVLSVALLLVFALMEYCRYFMYAQLVNNAAREGARLAVVSTNLQDTSTIQSTTYQYLANSGLLNTSGTAFTASNVTVNQVVSSSGALASDSNWYDAQFGSSIMVQVNAEFKPMFPTFGFLPSTVKVTGTAMMSSEAN